MSTSYWSEYSHMLTIVQQPIRARSMGPGERDRRPVDPCPIVKLTIVKSDGTEDEKMLWEHTFVMHATLFDESGTIERMTGRNVVVTTSENTSDADRQASGPAQGSYEQIGLGTLVSSAHHVRDLDDKQGCFFCFPDIRVRHPGVYRLRFSLLQLPHTNRETTESTRILCNVLSEPFEVFSPKDFPGVDESTALTKKLALQGVGIPIRNKGRLRYDNSGREGSSQLS
ncbi:hypothetical protein H4S08_000491 [Coemansia sp. RSA 1365]|nr:hypothetical protein H4S08_000491 [Coemansia sp. RSA 1365]